jgi:hypothetical protein
MPASEKLKQIITRHGPTLLIGALALGVYYYLASRRYEDPGEPWIAAAFGLFIGTTASSMFKGRSASALNAAIILTVLMLILPLWPPSPLELVLVNAVPGLLVACFGKRK